MQQQYQSKEKKAVDDELKIPCVEDQMQFKICK